MRLLVCGGRHWDRVGDTHRALSDLHALTPIETLIHGDAPGADTIARQWAGSRGVPCRAYPARWRELGPAAGPVRNTIMLRDGRPDGVLAFPGGKGTADMVRKARAAGINVIEFPG